MKLLKNFIDYKMGNKKVKVLVDNKIIDAILEHDQKFYGGSKVTYQTEDKTKCIISSKLIKII